MKATLDPSDVRTQVDVKRTPMAKFLPSGSVRTTVRLPCMTAQAALCVYCSDI